MMIFKFMIFYMRSTNACGSVTKPKFRISLFFVANECIMGEICSELIIGLWGLWNATKVCNDEMFCLTLNMTKEVSKSIDCLA